MLQTRKIRHYLDALKDCGVGGRVDACFQALVYLKTKIDGVNIADVNRALAKLTIYRTHLRKGEATQDRLRRE